MRDLQEIYADMESLLRAMPMEDSRRLILLAQEMAETKAWNLFQAWKQAQESRQGV